MLKLLSVDDSHRLLAFFESAGYTEISLRKHLGAAELPSRRLRNEPRLLDRTSEPTTLNGLLRWFWLGRPQTEADVKDSVGAELRSLLLDCGLLVADRGSLLPTAMLLPVGEFLVASDHPSSIDNGRADMVLWPNPTSKFLARFALRRQSRATLDLGTGSGILSLGAAGHSQLVVATDLNPRATAFAEFNARINNVDNIEVLTGDAFEPVQGRRFDLILSNPPFFITPKTDYLFCENSMELDELCRRLAREAPRHLHEGGYLQMLCEWAQIGSQPWEERIAEWFEGTGCDVWVMKGLTQDPEEYAQHRILETTPDIGRDSELYDGYMAYYRERKVTAIHDGLIVMRRREGANWVRLEEVPKTASGDLGELVSSTFAAHDLLREMETNDMLLGIRPRLADTVRLEQVCTLTGDRWRAESLTLRLIAGFPFHLEVQPLVAEFLSGCNGEHTVRQLIQAFGKSAAAPPDVIERECLAMIRLLIERGFVVANPRMGTHQTQQCDEG